LALESGTTSKAFDAHCKSGGSVDELIFSHEHREVVGIFPNVAATVRLGDAVPLEWDEKRTVQRVQYIEF